MDAGSDHLDLGRWYLSVVKLAIWLEHTRCFMHKHLWVPCDRFVNSYNFHQPGEIMGISAVMSHKWGRNESAVYLRSTVQREGRGLWAVRIWARRPLFHLPPPSHQQLLLPCIWCNHYSASQFWAGSVPGTFPLLHSPHPNNQKSWSPAAIHTCFHRLVCPFLPDHS